MDKTTRDTILGKYRNGELLSPEERKAVLDTFRMPINSPEALKQFGIDPKSIEITCNKCKKTYLPNHLGEFHFCPNCGKEIKDDEED